MCSLYHEKFGPGPKPVWGTIFVAKNGLPGLEMRWLLVRPYILTAPQPLQKTFARYTDSDCMYGLAH